MGCWTFLGPLLAAADDDDWAGVVFSTAASAAEKSTSSPNSSSIGLLLNWLKHCSARWQPRLVCQETMKRNHPVVAHSTMTSLATCSQAVK